MNRRNTNPVEEVLGADHWLTHAVNLPYFTDPGPERIDQIDHRLACLCTYKDSPPWRFELVDEGDGYSAGSVWGGENSEYEICNTTIPYTSEFIANAPDDIRWLLDRVAYLEARLEEFPR